MIIRPRAIAAVAGLAACLAPPAARAVAPPPFSFTSVEFMDRDQRLPAAQAFLARNLTPGMPMSAAVTILRRAGTYCHAPRDGVVTCTHSSMQRHPAEDLQDVTWTVKLTPASDGALGLATVSRAVAGN